uniref:Plp n=1 Tax=Ganoderma boninense TaxID=34458 RepID=A0A5K1K562_9APHY|nr:Plp [Ganoderma boninense]
MLQQSGWSEGEALGAAALRRTLTEKSREKRPARTILDDRELSVRTEEREVAVGTDDDICEVRKVDVVDLTLSDSEGDEDEFQDADDVEMDSSTDARVPQSSWAVPSHKPTALLTPIATVLKSDRLGIGLKAKTEGPYKASKKRVTHNQAALAAHTKANEDMRRRKALFGRGAKSFARIAKAEAQSRQKLLTALKQ